MQIPVLSLPKAVAVMRDRQPQDTIPQTKVERERIKLQCVQYIEREAPVPPLSFEELRKHSERMVEGYHLDPRYRDYVAVVLNSELWRDQLATVPFERR